MASAVEATSSSSLMELASEPPMDPRGYQIPIPQPLVLYIAKVPGSRDVFLTPIKPRDKVITVEDISSSLYFLHVHCPDDERILRQGSPSASVVSQTSQASQASHTSHISHTSQTEPPPPPPHRTIPSPSQRVSPPPRVDGPANTHHPLPPTPQENGERHPLPPLPGMSRPQRPAAIAIKRKPIGDVTPPLQSQRNITNYQNMQAGVRSPGLLSPRSQLSPRGPISPPYPEQEMFPNVNNWTTSRHDLRSPLRNEYHDDDLMSTSAGSDRRGSEASFSVKAPSEDVYPNNEFTLIRRDPATGEQWNVARLIRHEASNYLTENGTKMERSKAWVEITMDSPGYAKFSNLHSSFGSSLSEILNHSGPSSLSNSSHTIQPFYRELKVAGSQTPNRKYGHVKSMSEDHSYQRGNIYYDANTRRGSDFASMSQVSLLSDGSAPSTSIPRKPVKKRDTGYSFLSPWNGRCEFSTSLSNSSLKCKHLFGPASSQSEGDASVQVSELRFNLPGSSNPTPSNRSTDDLHRTPKFFGLSRKRADSFDSNPTYSWRGSEPSFSASVLDLSLGQERVGGGFGGKQAKLGKLIIENEGLMMLDLLIAANMSLWWRAYER